MERQRHTKHFHLSGDWWLRFLKGMFIGSGFILPGISGGALAAIFGLYEKLINFLADIRKDFLKNIWFFLPVGLGALAGIVVLSFGVSFLLGNYETIILWFFVGCIVGTIPALWKEAGKEGRSMREYVILVAAFIIGIIILYFGQAAVGGKVSPNFATWMIAGGLIALGIIVPGLSPSNFIVYMGMYKEMSDGFKTLDLQVLVPIALGGLVTLALFSKLVHYIFTKAYPQLFHAIFGIVMASTVMIIPTDYSGFHVPQYLACVALLGFGAWVGAWMAQLEDTYK